MPTNAANPKPRATKPRETAAQKRARLAEAAAREAVEQMDLPGVQFVSSLPEVPGGAPKFSSKDVPTVEREILFHYDGVGYSIPKTMPYTATLRYAHTARTQGVAAAVDEAMESAIGTVGYGVLLTAPGIPGKEVERFVGIVLARLEGTTDPK
jgi:hypothetical protein